MAKEFGYTDWISEEKEFGQDGRKGVYWLEIFDQDGEEYAVVVHRTCDGLHPIDGPIANRRMEHAKQVVDALNVKVNVIGTAAMLLGNDRYSVDPEYSRAIAELVNELTGTGAADDVEATETMLWAIATGEDDDKGPALDTDLISPVYAEDDDSLSVVLGND